MGLPRFFRLSQHKRFNFVPRYYDERKEELEKRVKIIEKEMCVGKDEIYVPRIRKGQMRGYFQKTRRVKKQSNIRLIIIIIVLFIITYFLLYH